MATVSFQPHKVEHWLYFIAAVFVAGIVINTIVNRVQVLKNISAGF
jgi:hypothetical protein